MKYIFLILLCLPDFALWAQPAISIQPLHANDSISFRGLSVPAESVIWVSGSKGTIGKSIDGGQTWEWMRVPGFEQRDFRDIEAFDANTAIVMAIAEPAQILKTTDGGKSWKIVFEDHTPGMFLDAMHFRDSRYGIVVGDPIDGKFFLKGTNDGGDSWQVDYPAPVAHEGEACFAASGTNIILQAHGKYRLVTGGKVSRILTNTDSSILSLVQGKETSGANSLACWKDKRCAVVGGDFQNDTDTTGNYVVSMDGGKSWHTASRPPQGYRSCVIYLDKRTLISCGTSGVDISQDGGQNWQLISNESYHVCQQATKGKSVYLAGSKGKIARLNFK